MTSLAVDRRVTLASRTLAVTRLQLTTNPILLVLPVLVLVAAFVVNLMIFSSVDRAAEGGATGGVASIYFTQMVIAWASVHQQFNLAVGLNVTRRAFYLGSVAVVVIESVLYGLVLVLGSVLERATDKWGVNLAFFNTTSLTDDASPTTFLVYAVPLTFVTMLGLFFGAVNKRFGTRNFFLLSVAAILVLGLIATLITYLNGWEPIVGWLARQSPLAIIAGWTLIPTVLVAVGGWFVLRRAVP